ncbi:MAG: hypothetical protein PWP24_1514, partial [Clostridiales bacterium]|nr:hypothetical protein [Clostridiales bacterium]
MKKQKKKSNQKKE